MTISENVMYANFGDPRSHDRDLGLKPRKNGNFWVENFINSLAT